MKHPKEDPIAGPGSARYEENLLSGRWRLFNRYRRDVHRGTIKNTITVDPTDIYADLNGAVDFGVCRLDVMDPTTHGWTSKQHGNLKEFVSVSNTGRRNDVSLRLRRCCLCVLTELDI